MKSHVDWLICYSCIEICFLIPDNSYKFPRLLEIQNKLERSIDNYNDSIRHQVHDEIRKIMGSSETFKPFSPILYKNESS